MNKRKSKIYMIFFFFFNMLFLTYCGGETGAGETGAGETGAGETGAGETGAGETGAGETGAGGVPVFSSVIAIADSGQSKCYNSSNSEVTCKQIKATGSNTSADDAYYGQDGHYVDTLKHVLLLLIIMKAQLKIM